MMLDDLLPYYEREMSHLRFLGQEFAREYPKIAARLQLEEDNCEDPHVERMIEAFAFLSARIHRKLDDDFPEIVQAFLEVLYPHYLRPTPSLSIVEFDPGANSNLTARYDVPRHTELQSHPVDGTVCRFRTCYDVTLWPLRMARSEFSLLERSVFNGHDKDWVAQLSLQFETFQNVQLGKLGLDRLRLFIDGESTLMHHLYELLFNNVARVSVFVHDGQREREIRLPPDALKPVGFQPDEGLIDYSERSFIGYRLLHEYFTFPDKFMFVDITGLERALSGINAQRFEIRLAFSDYEQGDRLVRLAQNVNRNTFRLGCTPIANLFPQRAEPIKLTHTRPEYAVIPDVRHQHGVEIISIDRVIRVKKTGRNDELSVCHPFFEPRGSDMERNHQSYWLMRRVPTARETVEGTDLYLRLVDRELELLEASSDTLSLTLTCSNRDLPQMMSFGNAHGDFSLSQTQVVSAIRCLRKPTESVRAPLGKGMIWRLVSHLSLNHMSLTSRGREALLEMLSLYNYRDTLATRKQINGITDIASAPTLTRIGHPRPNFVRGTAITLEMDESQFTGSGIFLFGMVLDHFFGQYCSVNSFTQLTLRSRQRERSVVTWSPRSGELPLV